MDRDVEGVAHLQLGVQQLAQHRVGAHALGETAPAAARRILVDAAHELEAALDAVEPGRIGPDLLQQGAPGRGGVLAGDGDPRVEGDPVVAGACRDHLGPGLLEQGAEFRRQFEVEGGLVVLLRRAGLADRAGIAAAVAGIEDDGQPCEGLAAALAGQLHRQLVGRREAGRPAAPQAAGVGQRLAAGGRLVDAEFVVHEARVARHGTGTRRRGGRRRLAGADVGPGLLGDAGVGRIVRRVAVAIRRRAVEWLRAGRAAGQTGGLTGRRRQGAATADEAEAQRGGDGDREQEGGRAMRRARGASGTSGPTP